MRGYYCTVMCRSGIGYPTVLSKEEVEEITNNDTFSIKNILSIVDDDEKPTYILIEDDLHETHSLYKVYEDTLKVLWERG